MKRVLLLGFVATFAVAGMARAAGPDPIAVRKAGQDLLAGNFDGIRGVVAAKGNLPKMADSAKSMAKWMQVFPSLFPPGSDKGETKALPAIWSDQAGFEKAAAKFADASDKLATLLKAGNIEDVSAQIKVVGQACGACHKAYRQR